MKIRKGQIMEINHTRKGVFKAIAARDFDTHEEWYPVVLATKEVVNGVANNKNWIEGEDIPCRGAFCIEVKVL